MCKKNQKLLALFILISLGILLMSKESYAAPTVRIVVNPDKTVVSVGSDQMTLTAQASGRNLQFKWELIGPGELKGDTTKPAIFYVPPNKISKKSAQTAIALTVTDDSGEDVTASVIFNIIQKSGDTLTPKLKYNFEDDSNGWIHQDYKGIQACVHVEQSDEKAKDGHYSLKMLMDLVGGDTEKNQGAALVDMQHNPPSDDEQVPMDLTDHTITAWVYAPKGTEGNKNKPNGFQLFVKDENWNSKYGTWHNINEEQWIQISLTVNTSKPKDGYIDQSFDPSQIIVIGVKMGAGSGSIAKYNGPIYVDAVDW